MLILSKDEVGSCQHAGGEQRVRDQDISVQAGGVFPRSCDEAIHLGERIKAQLVSLMEVAERVIFNAREARERLLVAEDLA